jgi:hypothetical protein
MALEARRKRQAVTIGAHREQTAPAAPAGPIRWQRHFSPEQRRAMQQAYGPAGYGGVALPRRGRAYNHIGRRGQAEMARQGGLQWVPGTRPIGPQNHPMMGRRRRRWVAGERPVGPQNQAMIGTGRTTTEEEEPKQKWVSARPRVA